LRFDESIIDKEIVVNSTERIYLGDKNGTKIFISQDKNKVPKDTIRHFSYKGKIIYVEKEKIISIKDKQGWSFHQYLGGENCIISSTKALKEVAIREIQKLILKERDRLPFLFVNKFIDRPSQYEREKVYNDLVKEFGKLGDPTFQNPNLKLENSILNKECEEELKRFVPLEGYQKIPREEIWQHKHKKCLPSGRTPYYQNQPKLTDNKNKNPDERPKLRSIFTPSAGQREIEKEMMSPKRTSKEDWLRFEQINIFELLKQGEPTITLDTISSEYQVGYHEDMEYYISEIQIKDSNKRKNRLDLDCVRTKKKIMMPSGMNATTEFNKHLGDEILRINKIEGIKATFADSQVIQEKYYKGSLLNNLKVEHRNNGKEIQVNGFLYKLDKNGELTKTYVREKQFAQKVAQKVPIIMECARQKKVDIDYQKVIKFYAQILKNLKNRENKIEKEIILYMNDRFEKMGGLWSRLIYFLPEMNSLSDDILGLPGD